MFVSHLTLQSPKHTIAANNFQCNHAFSFKEKTMSKTIDYYFTCISPFAYLGHGKLMEIAKAHDKTVHFKPFDIFGVWKESGAQPPAERAPVRQRYRMIEIQRVAVMRDVCMNPSPKHFPTNPAPADLCITALVHAGLDPAGFSHAVGRACWEQNLDVASHETLISLLEECGHDSKMIMELADSEEITELRNANTQAAISSDAIGAPAYVYDGEVFWGQDRLEYLEHMIASGRKAFSHDV
jgi:2-hydroxychromene-2-carboxylate isomerase